MFYWISVWAWIDTPGCTVSRDNDNIIKLSFLTVRSGPSDLELTLFLFSEACLLCLPADKERRRHLDHRSRAGRVGREGRWGSWQVLAFHTRMHLTLAYDCRWRWFFIRQLHPQRTVTLTWRWRLLVPVPQAVSLSLCHVQRFNMYCPWPEWSIFSLLLGGSKSSIMGNDSDHH